MEKLVITPQLTEAFVSCVYAAGEVRARAAAELTAREATAYRLFRARHSNQSIAEHLGLGYSTVAALLRSAREKLAGE